VFFKHIQKGQELDFLKNFKQRILNNYKNINKNCNVKINTLGTVVKNKIINVYCDGSENNENLEGGI
jgi:hypothetical protein